jgi:hypothetical protein
MAQHSINALQEATVAVMREQAVAGGTMKEMKKALGERWQKAISAPPVFTDAGGHTWDTGAYLQMNIRTNTMRVYNDCLIDDVARTTGSDLVRVSTGGDPMCRLCAPWEGVILSVSGKTKGFPTYEQARQAGCFHPNCVHTIETVDDVWDGDEIELQKAHPVTKDTATDPDAMDERKYKMDQERYRRKGMDADKARLAVDRDNLEANIRHGLIRSDARAIVDKLTDAQVTALCKDGNPPRFEPTKKATKKNPHAADEKWIRGKRGGVVHIKRTADDEKVVDTTNILDAAKKEYLKRKADGKTTAEEDELAKLDIYKDGGFEIKHPEVNPDYSRNPQCQDNCQRCVVAWGLRLRGYDVEALPSGNDFDISQFLSNWNNGYGVVICKNGRLFKKDVENEMLKMGNGAKCIVRIKWKSSGAHFFIAENIKGNIFYTDPQDLSRKASEHFLEAGGRTPGDNWIYRFDGVRFSNEGRAIKPHRR